MNENDGFELNESFYKLGKNRDITALDICFPVDRVDVEVFSRFSLPHIPHET